MTEDSFFRFLVVGFHPRANSVQPIAILRNKRVCTGKVIASPMGANFPRGRAFPSGVRSEVVLQANNASKTAGLDLKRSTT
jgi:hypothetical protein